MEPKKGILEEIRKATRRRNPSGPPSAIVSLGIYFLVAERIHFTLFGIVLPTLKLKVYTFWGL